MDPTTPGPTARPIGLPVGSAPDRVDAADAQIPWIDVHQHTGSLTWNDRNRFDLSGARAVVAIAASYYWSPYRPVDPGDVRFLWDDAIRRAETFTRSHFYDQYVAVGIHTWSRVEDYDELLAVLPEYCELDSVVAIGETGIESSQHTSRWELADQADAVAGQMRIAKETGLPILLHTPGSSKGGLPDRYADRYEEPNGCFVEHVLDPENAKAEAVEICLDLKDEVGLPDEQVVIDHATPEIAPAVLGGTDCYLAFSVRPASDVGPEDVAAAVEEYGPDRVLVDTDLIGATRNDPFVMKRTIFDLLRIGVDPADVRTVVYDNPRELLGLDRPE